MINRIFFSDKKLLDLEITRRWYETVEYLNDLFEKHKHFPVGEEILCTALFQTWYVITEVFFNNPERYSVIGEYEEFYSSWKHFFACAIDFYIDSPSVCYFAGYTAVNLPPKYKIFNKAGEELMMRAKRMSSFDLPFDLLMGRKRKDKNDIYYVRPDLLFPSNSAADNYFRKLLIEIINEQSSNFTKK